MRYDFTAVSMAEIRQAREEKVLERMWREENPSILGQK